MFKRFIKDFAPGLIAALVILLLTSCDPQKRINRILNKHPELKRDTVITVRDTVITKHFAFDTLYNYTLQHDTVFLKRENVTVKVYHHNDTVYIKTDVKPDTIIKTISIPVKRVVYETQTRRNWVLFWLGAFLGLFVLILSFLALKKYKP